jgi:hypothetical protein
MFTASHPKINHLLTRSKCADFYFSSTYVNFISLSVYFYYYFTFHFPFLISYSVSRLPLFNPVLLRTLQSAYTVCPEILINKLLHPKINMLILHRLLYTAVGVPPPPSYLCKLPHQFIQTSAERVPLYGEINIHHRSLGAVAGSP